MPTTTSTTGTQVILQAGESLNVSTTGEAFIDLIAGVVGAGYTSVRVLSQFPRQIGPFAGSVTVRIRASSGTAQWTPSYAKQQAFIARDAFGLPTGIVDDTGAPVAIGGTPAAQNSRLGIALFEGEGSATPGTSAGANTVIHSAGMVVNSAGETVFRVDASASQATGNWFEIIVPNAVFGYGPVSANAASVEFTTNPGQGTPLTISLATSNAYTAYVQATRTLAAPAVGDPFQNFGRMAFTVLDSEWVKTGFSSATSEQTWGAAKIRIPVNNGQRRVFDLRSFRVGGTKGKGRLCVISDDGYASFYRLGVPIFEEYGIKTTTAVIADSVGAGFDAVTLKDLQDYVARGHQCVAHGPIGGAGNIIDKYTNNTDRVADMTFHRDWIVSNGLAIAGAEKCYVWPQGRYAPTAGDVSLLDAAYGAGFRLGRSATPNATSVQVRSLSKESHQRFTLPIVGHNYAGADNTPDDAAETTNINTIITRIQALGANRSDGFLMLHRVVGKGLATATNISIEMDRVRTLAAAIRAEIDAGRLEAVWMSELI